MTEPFKEISITDLLHDLRDLIMRMTPTQRLELREIMLTSYCRHCGRLDPNCQCSNDE